MQNIMQLSLPMPKTTYHTFIVILTLIVVLNAFVLGQSVISANNTIDIPHIWAAFFESDTEVIWRLVKDSIGFIALLITVAIALFAAWRGKSYIELERLATTREKIISDQAATIIKLEARVTYLENDREELREKNLRLQGDVDHIHRSKS